MTPEEINERAWKQMQAILDSEIELLPGEDIWDARIRLRDKFYNELYEELNNTEMRQI